MPLKLEKLAQRGRREADLRGALKNTDQATPGGKPAAEPPERAPGPEAAQKAPSVATGDIGSADDEQLSQATDVLRGLALVTSRPAP
jgi:hypothetical protein